MDTDEKSALIHEAYQKCMRIRLKNEKNRLRQKAMIRVQKRMFGKAVLTKQEREALKANISFRTAVEKELSKFQEYQRLVRHPEIFLQKRETIYIQNRELIEKMYEDGYRNFLKKDFVRYQKEEVRIQAEKLLEDYILSNGYSDPEELAVAEGKEICGNCVRLLKRYFSRRVIWVMEPDHDSRRYVKRWKKSELSMDNFTLFRDGLPLNDPFMTWEKYYCEMVMGKEDCLKEEICRSIIRKLDRETTGLSNRKYILKELEEKTEEAVARTEGFFPEEEINRQFTEETIWDLMRKNPHYTLLMQELDQIWEEDRRLKNVMLDHIPDRYIDLFPSARKIKRKFILHIGPTNSGKTYAAVHGMLQGKTGIYLGPLRLLAFEQYEKINEMGYACSLLTGEEEIRKENAPFQASTVEMMDIRKRYDTAVIDEAQLIADSFRGGAWTAAILGVNANVVHICAAPYAGNLLIRLIEECGDEYEIMRHERRAELSCDEEPFVFPESVKKGDALLVFSRKSVHSVAVQLQQRKIPCSVIYGALPYDVRHEEARKFSEGETEVLVATDAIGLGLNLPIRRVVLLEVKKYDGIQTRLLEAGEVQQIIGRAGRVGIYETGFFNVEQSFSKEDIRKKASREIAELKTARIGFPETLLGINTSVSDILSKWNEIEPQEGFLKASVEGEIRLAKMLEEITDDKDLIYRFVMIPFDQKDDDLLSEWYSFARDYILYDRLEVPAFRTIKIRNGLDLKCAEKQYALMDLYYQLAKKFMDHSVPDSIMKEKEALSEKIIRYLSSHKLKGNT
ncbi:MAG: hypothetical protein E7294_02465 [Lachnospiraceae bacterium]|jgi:ATP-dependent RNA helicase SUPV3L1/SUV3|nr:hypothetical protein [Lachnospiraceae bacterium]